MKKSERSERSRRGLAEAKSRGVVLGNPNILEVQRQSVAARQSRADAFAREMRPIFAELKAQGIVTYYALARTLNKRKIPSARGGLWTGVRVKWLLKRIAGFDSG
jgi:DNA invertase Pin-like site-specific DNA recombinase